VKDGIGKRARPMLKYMLFARLETELKAPMFM
jgi:hypothetical protein